MKSTVKIKTVLFGTFRYTFQLLLYIVAAPIETFVVAWYQLSNTLVIEDSRLCIAGHTVETLRNTSAHSVIGFSLWFSFRGRSDGKKNNKTRKHASNNRVYRQV